MSTREVNQTELSALIGVTTRQIRNLEHRGLPHRAEKNQKLYPVPDAIQWYIDRKRDEVLSEIQDLDLKQAKARREAARARMAEIELAREEGDLISREAVEVSFGDEMLDRIRAALLNMPGRWGPQMGFDDPRRGEAALKEIAAEILEHLSGAAADDVAIGASDDLPEDLPGRSQLEEAGIETLAELLRVDDLQDIHGIGPVTEQEIEARLSDLGRHVA